MTSVLDPRSERLLSRVELSERWNKSTKSLRRWEKSGKLKALTLGPRTVRYRLSDVLAFEDDATARN